MPDDVAAIIDRTFRTYLEPPDRQPATCKLSGAIDNDDDTLIVGSFTIPEDEELMRQGVIIEIGSELIEVGTYDEITGTCADLVRGFQGTTPVAHADGVKVKLSPSFARQSVFEAIADNIITLYPDLYTVEAANITGIGPVAPIEDPLAVEVIEVWDHTMSVVDVDARLVDFHPATGDRAVITDYAMGSYWIRYRRRFGAATSEADSLEDLGVDPRWVMIVMVGACADLFVGRDIEASHTSWVQAVLEAEQVPVGTRVNIAAALANYRQRLLNEAKQEMRAEYRTKVHSRHIQVVDTGWGW